MGYKFCKPYKGYYCGQLLRSFNEFIVAVTLEVVEKVIWKTESIILEDCNGKRKIPDFVIYNTDGQITRIIEVKNNDQEAEDVLVDYVNRRISIDHVRHDFIGMSRPRKQHWIKKITDVIGFDEWVRISKSYKSQTSANIGFIGQSNPMFGRKHSVETKAKLSEKAQHFGEQNGMFGRKHSKEAKNKMARDWTDPEIKAKLQRKGFIKHFSSLNQQEKVDVTKYFMNRFAGIKSIKPSALNNFYSMNREKAIDLFENEEMFFCMLKGLTTNDT